MEHRHPMRTVELAEGRSLELIAIEDTASPSVLAIRSPSGDIELSITVGPDGPSVRLRAVDIAIEAARGLKLQCATLDIDVAQSARIRAGEDMTVEAAAGTLALRANDDVDVHGERILLNSNAQPMARTWDEHAAKLLGPTSGDSDAHRE